MLPLVAVAVFAGVFGDGFAVDGALEEFDEVGADDAEDEPDLPELVAVELEKEAELEGVAEPVEQTTDWGKSVTPAVPQMASANLMVAGLLRC